jgi:hypothetical protein
LRELPSKARSRSKPLPRQSLKPRLPTMTQPQKLFCRKLSQIRRIRQHRTLKQSVILSEAKDLLSRTVNKIGVQDDNSKDLRAPVFSGGPQSSAFVFLPRQQ